MSPLRKAKHVRQRIGYVPDKPDAYGWMKAQDLLRFLRPQYPTWDRDYANSLLDQLQVPRDTPFKSMSRGQGMKAMLVAALAPRPELLLLDEPFAGLDPMAREDVLSGVLAELQEGAHTVLCATHDLDVAARIADRVAVLAHGKITQHGDVAEVLGSEEPFRIPEQMHEILAKATAEVAPCHS